MNMLVNKQNTKNKSSASTSTSKVIRDRFIIGSSECYFEPAAYLTGRLDEAAIKRLFLNPHSEVHPTEGKSLKVMFKTKNEVKFIGFVTAGDASLDLDETDIVTIVKHAREEEIIRAVDVDELVSMF